MLKQSYCIRTLRNHLLIKIQVSLMDFINFLKQEYKKDAPISAELLWGKLQLHYFSTSKLFFKVLSLPALEAKADSYRDSSFLIKILYDFYSKNILSKAKKAPTNGLYDEKCLIQCSLLTKI